MSSNGRWQRVREIFQATVDLNADARAEFLSGACGNDATLRHEVQSLFAAHAQATGFLETPPVRFSDAPPGRPAPTLHAGDRLGRFEVTGALGAGGMGEVYRARDTRLGREVAIKVLPPAFSVDAQRLARFERESRVLASLNHPNIATIHDIEQVGGLRVLVLELIEGPTLAERLKDGPLPLREVLAIARQLVLALGAAHARSIVHRDLKPANVKIATSGHVTLLDFGLAKVPTGDASVTATLATAGLETTAGLILGTLNYMSPEQARGRAVDQRADVWAFGCVLFEMLAGRPAFERETPSDTIVAVLEHEPDWSALPAALPAAVHRLIRRCLAKDPAARMPDIEGAVGDIEEALQQAEEIAAGGPSMPFREIGGRLVESGTAAPTRQQRKWWTWRPRGLPALAAALVAAVAVAGSYLGRQEEPIASLAVLPFENRSSGPDTEYLGEEIAENVIGQMSRVRSITVMARGTTARFKGTADPRAAGQSLGVGAVLSGTVLQRAGRLTIAVELIDVRSGARLWGETFDQSSAELPDVQARIAEGIADGMRLRFGRPAERALLGPATRNAEANELAMRARHLLMSDSEVDDLRARELFERAAALDPAFVEAHLGVASTYLRAAANGYAPPGVARDYASAALERVLALDPENVRARAAKASLSFQRDWNWVEAERGFRGLVADARLYLGPQYYAPAVYFLAIGRPDEAAAVIERALKTDPGNIESRVMLCDLQAEAGRLPAAERCYRAVAGAAPEDARPLFGLAEVLRRRGDLPGAIETLRNAYRWSGLDLGVRMLAAARTEQDYRAAELAVARASLDDLRGSAKQRYVMPLDLARLYALVGDREAAFAALDQAVAERSPMLVLLKVDRAWDGIRDDPRFASIVRRVGIP